MCAFSAREARDELIKWWINLKNGGKKVENKEKYQRRTKKPARKSESSNLLLCCVLCALFGRKKEFSGWQRLVFCVVLFSPSCSCSCSFSRFACTTWSCVCMYTREMLVFSIFIPPRPRTLQFVSGHPFSLA